ncbi:MAG TPA: hypothetical protein VF310_08385 [Vicinamibacteria bacterium]
MEGENEVQEAKVRRALSDFYREEFLRHLQHLESHGFVHDGNRAVVDRACAKLMTDLERVCRRPEFPALAETLLQSFDALTRLSELPPRSGH